jgi:iron-sulfur cluster assembly protein
MFSIPGKQAVTMTPAACASDRADDGARREGRAFGSASRRAAARAWNTPWSGPTRATPLDEVVEQDGARVLIAPMAQMFLIGTELDYETGLSSPGSSSATRTWSRPAAAERASSSPRRPPADPFRAAGVLLGLSGTHGRDFDAPQARRRQLEDETERPGACPRSRRLLDAHLSPAARDPALPARDPDRAPCRDEGPAPADGGRPGLPM